MDYTFQSVGEFSKQYRSFSTKLIRKEKKKQEEKRNKKNEIKIVSLEDLFETRERKK